MQTSLSVLPMGRTWRFPRMVLKGHLILLTIIWAMALVISLTVTLGIARFGEVAGSVWEHIAGLTPWVVGFIGGYVMFVTVPLFVANGRTRRDSMIEWSIFAAVYSATTALLVVIGYLLEYVLFGAGNWPRMVAWSHLFTSHTDVGRMFLEYLLTSLVWTAAGGFAGISIYRSPGSGWLSLIPVSILVGLMGEVSRTPVGPFGAITERLPVLYASSVGSTVLIAAICVTIFVALTWPVARDFPIRNQ